MGNQELQTTNKLTQYPGIDKLTPGQISLAKALVEASFSAEKKKTITAICEEAGVGRESYYHWRLLPEFKQYRSWLVKQISSERLADVVNAVVENAVAGSAAHAKIYLEYQREVKNELDVNIHPLGGSSSGENVNTLRELKERAAREKSADGATSSPAGE